MPTPTLAINSVEIKIAVYCIKKSIFDIYNANATHAFDARTAPGYWVGRNKLAPTLEVVSSATEFPESLASINIEGKVGTDITTYAHRTIQYTNIIRSMLLDVTLGDIADGASVNEYWAYASANDMGTARDIVVPTPESIQRPTKILVWHRINYSVDGQPGIFTATGSREICLAGIYDYPINSTLLFAFTDVTEGDMYSDFNGYTPLPNPITSQEVAMIRGFARIRGKDIADIQQYFNPNANPSIMVGVKCYAADEVNTIIPGELSYQVSSIAQIPTTSLTVGAATFSLTYFDAINNHTKYYPHVFYLATIMAKDPLSSTNMILNRTVVLSDWTIREVTHYEPVICLTDLDSINSDGQHVWTDPYTTTIPIAGKREVAFADALFENMRKGVISYSGLGALFVKKMKTRITNPTGAATITIAENDYKVVVPANTTLYGYSPLSQQWEAIVLTNSEINLSTGTTRPAASVTAGNTLNLDVPFKLEYATPTILGFTMPASLNGQPLRLPIQIKITHTISGSTETTTLNGNIYLLSNPTFSELSVSVTPATPTQANGWRFMLLTRIYLQADFPPSELNTQGTMPGYNRKIIYTATGIPLTRNGYEFRVAGSQSAHGLFLCESYQLYPGYTIPLQAGNNTVTVKAPEHLDNPSYHDLLMAYFNYLAGATGTLDVRYPFNMDDNLSSTVSISIPTE